MAKRPDEAKKKKIIADFAMTGNYSETARMNGVSDKTVKAYVEADPEFSEISEIKAEQNTMDILEYMDKQRERVCEIIDVALEVLPTKIMDAKSASEVTTAMGTLIDKFSRQLPTQNINVSGTMTLSDKMAAIKEAVDQYGR